MTDEPEYRTDDIPVLKAAKRLGLQRCVHMEDWFLPWSPRNDNNFGEGSWHHWANLAAMILSHPATQVVAPDLYQPELKPDPSLYSGGNQLTPEQITEWFSGSKSKSPNGCKLSDDSCGRWMW